MRKKQTQYDPAREARLAAQYAHDNSLAELFEKQGNAQLEANDTNPVSTQLSVPYADPSLSTPTVPDVTRRQLFAQPWLIFHGVHTNWWFMSPPNSH